MGSGLQRAASAARATRGKAAKSYVVEVNEAAIWASRRGSDWWNEWRLRMERTGRITIITPSPGGDRVRVACDSKEDAEWLAGHMHEFAGIPKAAVKVRTK